MLHLLLAAPESQYLIHSVGKHVHGFTLTRNTFRPSEMDSSTSLAPTSMPMFVASSISLIGQLLSRATETRPTCSKKSFAMRPIAGEIKQLVKREEEYQK